jgi:hypothetical protein
MPFVSRDLTIDVFPQGGMGGYHLMTCKPASPAPPPDDKGKPPCPKPSCKNSAPGAPKPKPPKPGPKKRVAAPAVMDLALLRQQLRERLEPGM